MAKLLQDRIDAIAKKVAIKQKDNRKSSGDQKQEGDCVTHALPYVSDNKRAIPNAILRSSLFGVVGKGAREYQKDVLKATVGGITIKYTGDQLDQSDLDVYLECLRRLSNFPLGNHVRFSVYNFLKALNRNTGKRDHQWIKCCFVRLTYCTVEINDCKVYYTGHLINEMFRDETSGEFVISLNKSISVLFSDKKWTGLQLKEREALSGKQLAKWLHGFFSSHDKPFPYKVDTLRILCGSDVKVLKTFKQKLKKALIDLSIATGWNCWMDENDLVRIKKKKVYIQ